MKISISFQDANVRKKLTDIGRGLESLEKPLSKVGDDLIDYFGKDVFDTQGKELGVAWRPLSVATLKARALRRGYYENTPTSSPKILVWTGNLRKGFEKTVSKFKLIVTNRDKNFEQNQKNRKMMGINKRVIETVITTIEGYIHKLIK